MRKSDVTIRHYDYRSIPVVNVKVPWSADYRAQALEVARDNGDLEPEVFAAWFEDYLERDTGGELFYLACEYGWDNLQNDAEEVFGAGVKVEAHGRSSGWAGVRGLADLEDWDAIALARWGRFTRYAQAEARHVPYTMADLAYLNDYRPMTDRAVTRALGNLQVTR